MRANPRWRAYPTRLEFALNNGQYLGDETVTVIGQGKNLSVHCGGPWVLMDLPKGSYRLSTDVAGEGHKEMSIHVPGQVIVHFAGNGNEAKSG